MTHSSAPRPSLQALAERMLAECEDEGQSARLVEDADADALRALLRLDTRDGPMRIRTARMDNTVVVVRTDADLWHEDRDDEAETAAATVTLSRGDRSGS